MQTSKTQHKIAALFALAVTTVVILTALSTLLALCLQSENKSKSLLSSSLSSLTTDIEDDKALSESDVKFQASNSVDTTARLPNVRDIENNLANYFNSRTYSSSDIEGNVLDPNSDLEALQENKAVFSRVIASNGDILFSSDLFDTYYLDYKQPGFNKIETANTCIYIHTSQIESGDKIGTIVQVGQYCSFSQSDFESMFTVALAVAPILAIVSYILGFAVAWILMRPLRQSYAQTMLFARNTYHDLLTPLTVAVSTAEAKLITKQYKEGLESVRDDLVNAQYSLELIKAKVVAHDSKLDIKRIDITKSLKELLDLYRSKLTKKDIHIQTDGIPRIYKQADEMGVKIIWKNLLENVYRHASSSSKLTIKVSEDEISFANAVKQTNYKAGVGLDLVKELCSVFGWKLKIVNNGEFIVIVTY